MWDKWDGKRIVKTEELYSKTADLLQKGIKYEEMLNWKTEEIMDKWEELCG